MSVRTAILSLAMSALAEMYAAFRQVLDVNGYSAIERGDTVRIVSRGRIEIYRYRGLGEAQ